MNSYGAFAALLSEKLKDPTVASAYYAARKRWELETAERGKAQPPRT